MNELYWDAEREIVLERNFVETPYMDDSLDDLELETGLDLGG